MVTGDYRFHGQLSNEEVVLVTKQHPFVLLKPLFIVALVLLIPVAATIFMPFNSFFGLLFIVCLLAGALRSFMVWHAWNNSVLLLTSERVVVLNQHGFTHRELTECNLGNIQQVSHSINGLLATLFGYGTITIHTGGAHAPFVIPNVPVPFDIQQEIQRVASGEGFVEEEEADSDSDSER